MTCLNAHILHHSAFLLGYYSCCDALKKSVYLFSNIRSSSQHRVFLVAFGIIHCSQGLLSSCSVQA